MKLIYVASSGNEYNLKAEFLKSHTANYHNWLFDHVGTQLQYGFRVAAFSKEAVVYETELMFMGPKLRRAEMVDKLHQDFEQDIRDKKPGRIIWGNWYIECFVVSSSTEADDNYEWTKNNVQFLCPSAFWIRDNTRNFVPTISQSGHNFLDFDYDFEYDYYVGESGVIVWKRDHSFKSKFLLTMQGGPIEDPAIFINGHTYAVHTSLLNGETVTIDSRNNSVIKTYQSGLKENAFDDREKEVSIFEDIPGGNLEIAWSGTFAFTLTIFEERSEPSWS